MTQHLRLTALAFAALGTAGTIALIAAAAGLALVAIAERADAQLADIDEVISRFTGEDW